MAPRHFSPSREFDWALERGDLRIASAMAKDRARELGRPIPLERALQLVQLAAVAEPNSYDAYAVRWLARWAAESAGATIEQAADVAASLAALPIEPEAITTIQQAL
jgi:hypothetical protein